MGPSIIAVRFAVAGKPLRVVVNLAANPRDVGHNHGAAQPRRDDKSCATHYGATWLRSPWEASRSSSLSQQPWISQALLYLAIMIAFLATLGLAHAMGLLGSVATRMRLSHLVRTGTQPVDGKAPTNAAARIQVPRPAGPVGPVPVLQKQPKNLPTDAPVASRGKNLQSSTDAE